MATIILTQADFASGPYQLQQVTIDDKDAEIKESIGRVQNDILDKLLGVTLKDAFDAEYVDPFPDKWKELIDGVVYVNSLNDRSIRFKGMKEALKAFTYADVLSKDTINTDSGQTRLMDKSTTKTVRGVELKQLKRTAFNNAVNIYQNARGFMYENIDDYPDWLYSQISFRK